MRIVYLLISSKNTPEIIEEMYAEYAKFIPYGCKMLPDP